MNGTTFSDDTYQHRQALLKEDFAHCLHDTQFKNLDDHQPTQTQQQENRVHGFGSRGAAPKGWRFSPPGGSLLRLSIHRGSQPESAFFHLKNISRLWPSLSDSVAETLIHAFISSRLDYCNGVLLGAPRHSPGQTAACPKLSCQTTHSYKSLAAHHPRPETPPLASSQVLHHLQTAPPHL